MPTIPRFPLIGDPLLRRIRMPADLDAATTVGDEAVPEEAGMTAEQVEAIWKAAVNLYRSGVHPALQLCLRREGRVVLDRAIGHARGNGPDDGAETIGIHGHTVWVKAQIHQLQNLSAHADRDELLRWCRALPAPPQRIFLNHGEDPARKALAAAIADELGWPRPHLPLTGEAVPW